MPKLLSTSFVIIDIGRGGRQGGNTRQPPHLLNENRILCIQYELSCQGEKTFPLIPVTKPGWQIQSKKTFQRYSFCKNLTDVTLVWEVGQQKSKQSVPIKGLLSLSQGSDYIQPTYVSWTPTFHLWAPQKSAQACDRILYKKVTYSVETFKKSNDFADVPLVCDDDSAILAQKVTLSFLWDH